MKMNGFIFFFFLLKEKSVTECKMICYYLCINVYLRKTGFMRMKEKQDEKYKLKFHFFFHQMIQ